MIPLMYKAIFVDFDDTLCIHGVRPDSFSSSGLDYRRRCIAGVSSYEYSRLNTGLVELLKEARKNGAKLFLVGHITTSLCIDIKKDYLITNIGEDIFEKYIGVCKREDKVPVICDVLKVYNMSKSVALVIDDHIDTNVEAEAVGIDARTPLYMQRYEGDSEE